MDNLERSFRDKAKFATGFYNADGTPSRGLGPKMGMDVTGPTPAPSLGERLAGGYRSAVASTNVGSGLSSLRDGLSGALTSKPAQVAGKVAGGAIKSVPVVGGIVDAAGMADVATDPNMGASDVAEQGGRLAGRWGASGTGAALGMKGGAALGALAGPAAPVAIPALSLAGGLAGGAAGYFGAEKMMDAGAGQTAPDQRSFGAVKRTLGMANPNGAPAAAPVPKDNSQIIGPGDPRYEQLMNTPHGGIVGQDELPSAQVARTTFKTNPFARAATPEAEMARQSDNFNRFEAPINAALAERVKANGGSSFRDGAAQALFNAKQNLNGSGIKVSNVDGTPTFTGDNRAGGGQMYRAADGSLTTDWSKTQAYADAIQRNAKDQDRLSELTRGAALSGDKEAVARLTAGDQRLAGIAKQAETERSLRDAVKNGSRNAALVLADMEKNQTDAAYKASDIALRSSELAAKREDLGLQRALQIATLGERQAAAIRAAEKDARDFRQGLDEKQRAYLKDISVSPDGKFDPQLYQNNLGRGANMKRQPGQTEDQFMADKASFAGLVTGLDNKQWGIDKLFASPAGTDPEKWYVNDGLRGGYVTESGKHISDMELRSLPTDQQRMFKELLLDQKSIPKKYRDQLKEAK